MRNQLLKEPEPDMYKSEFKNNRQFPSWHFSMLNDFQRNDAMEESIKDLDVAGKTVFEIGTGVGLMAMLFAKHGAKKILTCEVNEQLCAIAKKNFAQHGFQDVIELIPKYSSKLIDDGDLDFSPDIIFTETLDCGIIGEGFNAISSDILRTRINIPDLHQRMVVQIDDSDSENIVNDKCPHRGGPLHLCYTDENGIDRCPWHDRRVPQKTKKCDSISMIAYKSSRCVFLVCEKGMTITWPIKYI